MIKFKHVLCRTEVELGSVAPELHRDEVEGGGEEGRIRGFIAGGDLLILTHPHISPGQQCA